MYLLIQEEYNNIPKEIQVESKFHFFISFLTIKMSYEKKKNSLIIILAALSQRVLREIIVCI